MGLFSVWVVNMLQESEIVFESIEWTSIGAIIAWLISLGYTTEEIKILFFDKITVLSDIFSFKTLNSTPLLNRLKELAWNKKMGDTKIPISINVTSKQTGERVILSSDNTPEIPLYRAMFASSLLKIMNWPNTFIENIWDCIDWAYSDWFKWIKNNTWNYLHIDCRRQSIWLVWNTISLTPEALFIADSVRLKALDMISIRRPFWIFNIPKTVSDTMIKVREDLFEEWRKAALDYLKNKRL